MPFVHAVANRLIASFLIVMGLAQIVLAVGLYRQQEAANRAEDRANEFSACTSTWQSDFLAAYTARSNTSYVVNQALDRLIRAVNSHDQAAFEAALHHYISVRDKQDKQRAEHPLPPLPSIRCGLG